MRYVMAQKSDEVRKKPNHLEFISQINALKSSKASSHRKAIYSAYLQEAQRMVTDGHYKLFFIPASKDAYLFDLEKDPQETNNLFGSPQYKRIVKRLCAEYQKLSKESGDTFNLAAIYPELFQ